MPSWAFSSKEGIIYMTQKIKSIVASFWHELKKNKYLFLLNLPAMLYVLINNYIPMPGIVLAFKKYHYGKGIFGSDWVGFKNFGFLFQTGDIYRITFNTIVYNVVFIITGIIFQVAVAVILSEIMGKYYKKVSQTLLLMPYFITWVVAGAIVYNFFQHQLRTDQHHTDFYGQGKDCLHEYAGNLAFSVCDIPYLERCGLWCGGLSGGHYRHRSGDLRGSAD